MLWGRAPKAIRRPVASIMRHEALRLAMLDKLGIRSRSGFITVSAGGQEAIDSAMRHVKATNLIGDYYEFGLYRGYTFWSAQKSAEGLGLARMRFYGFDSFTGLPEVTGEDGGSQILFPGHYKCARQGAEVT